MPIRLQAPPDVTCSVPMDAARTIVVETEAEAHEWARHGFTRVALMAPVADADAAPKRRGRGSKDGAADAPASPDADPEPTA